MAHVYGPGGANATPQSPSGPALSAPQPMSPDELLGKVTALYLKDQLAGDDAGDCRIAVGIGR